MKSRRLLTLKLYFYLAAAFVLAAAPIVAQTLSAQPGAVDFIYDPANPTPVDPQSVTVIPSDGSQPAISTALTLGPGTPSNLFNFSSSGLMVNVGVTLGPLATLAAKGSGIYTANILLTAAGFPSLNIPVTIAIGKSLALQAAPLTLVFDLGGTASQTVNLTASNGIAIGFTFATATDNGGAWLSAAATNTYTPATLTVTAKPGTLPSGTYTGSIVITPATGGAITIPVTLGTGSSASLTANPTSFTFNYTLGGAAPAAQVLSLSSTRTNNTYTAQASSTGNWLLVNGITQPVAGALNASLNITINTANLSPGVLQGNISVTSGDGGTLNIPVTLNVTGISAIANPTVIAFAAQSGGQAPATQLLDISGSPGGHFTAVVTSGVNWLLIGQNSGTIPAQESIMASSSGLATGTYSGNIAITTSAGTQNVQVTLTVSANPVLLAVPGTLMVNYKGGDPAPAPIPVNINVNSGPAQTFSVSSGLPSWLQVTPASNPPSTPSNLMITINPAGLASGTYLDNLVLTPVAQGSIPVTVPILLTVSGMAAIVPSSTSLTFSGVAGAAPISQTLQITAGTSTPFTTAATTNTGGSWLSVTPASGTAGTTSIPVTITADATHLGLGTYQGTVSLTTTSGVVTQIPVTFNVGTAVFSVSPATLAFSYAQGGAAPASQTLQVSGTQSFTASAATTDGAAWLAVSPASGTGATSMTASVNPAGLTAGTYTGAITVTPAAGTAQTVGVTLTVTGTTSLAASPLSVALAYRTGDPAPNAQTVALTSTGNPIAFTASASSSGWLSVTPGSGTTPGSLTVSVNPADLGPGTYNGTVTVSGPAGVAPLTISVRVSVTAPLPVMTSVVNAASYLGGGISPGEIVVIFGESLGPSAGKGATVDASGHIATSLAGVQVTFNGYLAPILYASSTQVNAIVPYEVAGAPNAMVEVTFGKSRSNSMNLPVVSSAPGIFSVNASGTGPGAILDANYHLVSASNPVAHGAAIQIYATGEGQTTPAGVDGLIAGFSPGTAGALPYPKLAAGVTIGGLPAQVTYVGAAPGLVAGALQVNAVVPDGIASGTVPVFLSIGGNSSQTGITIVVQ